MGRRSWLVTAACVLCLGLLLGLLGGVSAQTMPEPDAAKPPAKGEKPRRASRKSPSPAAASAPPPKKSYSVEVIKGNKRTEEKVD